ncbi:hypothetical protein [Streptomyces sp. NPDC006552]|uniref:hypothetical protein n=1 Tax=Streptomyces sp. NPDC006552 TaxID=3157179 RepID=UPI0033BCA9E1
MTEVSTRGVQEAAAVEELRASTTTLSIPQGFDLWQPEEMEDWLNEVEDDPDVSDTDYYQARQAVLSAMGKDAD